MPAYSDAIAALVPATFIPFDDPAGSSSPPNASGTLYDYTGFPPDVIGDLQFGETGIIPSQPADPSFRFGGATDFSWLTPLFTDPDFIEWPSFVPFSAVMRISFQSSLHQVVLQEYAGGSFRCRLERDASGYLVWNWLGTSTLWRAVTSSVALATGTAYTVGVVMARPTTTSMTLAIYVDGAEVATQTWTSESPRGLDYEILLNQSSSSIVDPYPLDALVAGVAAWGSALTAGDMLALHEAAVDTSGGEAHSAEVTLGGGGALVVTAINPAIPPNHYSRSVDFGGSGQAFQFPALSRSGAIAGSGAFALTTTGGDTSGVHFIADGNLVVTATRVIVSEMVIAILDPVIRQAPTALTVTLSAGVAQTAVEFFIDGTSVWAGVTDSSGSLAPTSINVPEALGAAGDHVLTAEQVGSTTASATFTLQIDPAMNPTTMGPDAQAVDVPGAVRPNGTRRWVFQDLMPGGLGSWIMPKNPAEGPMPYSEREFATRVTTTGRPHVTEGMRVPVEWSFSGIAINEEFAEKLLAYRDLNRRFYIINHRGQAFKVVLANVELVPRMRKSFGDNDEYLEAQWIDGHDYTVTATVLDQDWVVPA